MKNLAKYGVRRPISLLMAVMVVIVLGFVSFRSMKIDLLPNMDLPYAVVVTTYGGASPLEVEEDVTKKVESAMMGVESFSSLESTSSEHFSMVLVTFSQGANMDSVMLDANSKLNMVNFGDGIEDPMLIKFDPSMMPIVVVSASKEFENADTPEENLKEMSLWMDQNDILTELSQIDGVASATLNGAADNQIQININPDNAYGLTEDDILEKIKNENIAGIGGVVNTGNGITMLRINNSITTLDELKNLEIHYDGTKIIKLDQIATVDYYNANTQSYMKINGKPAVSISFQKTAEGNTLDVATAVTNKLSELEDKYDMEFIYTLDQSEYINQSLGSVATNLAFGAILAVLILLLFLKDIRPTLIVAVSIPLSVVTALVMMYFAGVTLNIISMGGLALGVGMLVDNSIVVIENIYRKLQEGCSRKIAAIQGATGVAMAITASTLTTVSVFIPIIFVEGMTKQMMQDLALTVTFSLIGSLLIAIAVVPAMASKMLKNEKQDGKVITGLKNKTASLVDKTITKGLYKPEYNKNELFLLRWIKGFAGFAVSLKGLIILLSFVLFAVSGLVTVNQVGFELMPASDEGQFTVNVDMKKGTSYKVTEKYLDHISEEIMAIDEVEIYRAEIGGNMMSMMFGGTQPTDTAAMTVVLKDNRKRPTSEVLSEVREIIDNVDFCELASTGAGDVAVTKDDVYEYQTSMSQGMGMSTAAADIVYEVKGTNLAQIEEVSNKIVEILEGVNGTVEHDNGIDQTADERELVIDRTATTTKGITATDVQNAVMLYYATEGISIMNEQEEVYLNFGLGSYAVTVPINMIEMGMQMGKITEEGILNANVYSTKHTNQMLNGETPTDNDGNLTAPEVVGKISDFAKIESITGFASISRDGNFRLLKATANVAPDAKSKDVVADSKDAVEKYLASDEFKNEYGNSVFVSESGVDAENMEMVADMMVIAVAAVFLVYLVMAIQFQSLVDPLIVMTTIPLAFTGGFIALFITGTPLSIVSIMGLVILTGIVVNNGIVMIDTMNQLLEEGMDLHSAIITAVKTRLKPILMTASTTALALVTMAIGIGEGSEMMQPMAITTIGGLVYSTILTLVVVPAFYASINKGKARRIQANLEEYREIDAL